MEVAYRNLALRCDGSERLVLVKAECGICKHIWDIQALDAVVCDLIHGETFKCNQMLMGCIVRVHKAQDMKRHFE